jgi:hypothetical protein
METDPELKRQAVKSLTHFRSEEGISVFEELLSK